MARLSEELALLAQVSSSLDPLDSSGCGEESTAERIPIERILKQTGERSFGVFLAILSFPSALPLPAPGYSTPFGLLIVLLAVQLAAGRTTPWLPQRLLQHSIHRQQLQRWVQRGIPWLRRIEKMARPRWTAVCRTRWGQGILGTLMGLMGISMIIPVPGTNTLPAMGVFVTAFGLMEEDGVLCSVGSLLCVAAGCLTTSILLGLWLGGTTLLERLGG